MTDDNSNSRLSRRKILGGVGMIGVASAGAGLGTTAYFSDRAKFKDNTLEAGQLELFVNFNAYEYQGMKGTYGPKSQTVSGKSPISIDVDDVKPGDWGKYQLCFDIVDNPAYLWLCGELTKNTLGELNRPKKKALRKKYDTDDDNGEFSFDDLEGQLADALDVVMYYCTPEEDMEDRADPAEGDVIAEGSLKEVLMKLRNGIPLDAEGDTGDNGLPVEDRNCFPATEENGENSENDVPD
ncbi:MAG: SipW-dependent-type signal peptide-containing protein, partial [Halobacteriota archaeon]